MHAFVPWHTWRTFSRTRLRIGVLRFRISEPPMHCASLYRPELEVEVHLLLAGSMWQGTLYSPLCDIQAMSISGTCQTRRGGCSLPSDSESPDSWGQQSPVSNVQCPVELTRQTAHGKGPESMHEQAARPSQQPFQVFSIMVHEPTPADPCYVDTHEPNHRVGREIVI